VVIIAPIASSFVEVVEPSSVAEAVARLASSSSSSAAEAKLAS
jgi:uncharacterized membrane protein